MLDQGLEGKTPAEMAGIETEDKNKWLGLIKKSLEANHRPELNNPK
jgi:hypothetical protein